MSNQELLSAMNENESHDENQLVDFDNILLRVAERRTVLKALGMAGMVSFFGTHPIAHAVTSSVTSEKSSSLLNFKAVAANTADRVIVPEGYRSQVLISWGEPIIKGAAPFKERLNTAAEQTQQFGDNNDGMSFFPLRDAKGKVDPKRGLLVVNNEYHNSEYLFSHGKKTLESLEDVRKAQAATGVSVIEIQLDPQGNWKFVQDSTFNRRIHSNTAMEMTGLVAGHAALKSGLHPDGIRLSGTLNNCANGQTPWGTYLTCEENFDGYFGSKEAISLTDQQKRYGLSTGKESKSGFEWYLFDERFDLNKHPNEANTFGWIVEIDPFDPQSVPKKRSALGRFKHENAAITIDKNGHVVVYMGDDERGEFIYKFVSKNTFDAQQPNAVEHRNLLAEGTLFVAQFDLKEGENKVGAPIGAGKWIPLQWGENGLTPENGFASQADVLIHARLAATQVGATTMDRPEWLAIDPHTGDIFCTLTNNKMRGISEHQPVNGPNPRINNRYGQIIRMMPHQKDHAASSFDWDLFVIAGNPTVHDGKAEAGSNNITPDNMFNSPDGIGFDQAGRLWIQTDGDYSNQGDFAGMGNNQMLCADPQTGEIRRFLTGPVACEVTGLAFTPDYKTMFVNIQHPGEKGEVSHFPHNEPDKLPRSSVVVITKNDGGVIGS